jgi:hypothetical protein
MVERPKDVVDGVKKYSTHASAIVLRGIVGVVLVPRGVVGVVLGRGHKVIDKNICIRQGYS